MGAADTPARTLGARLREERERAGLSLRALGAASGRVRVFRGARWSGSPRASRATRAWRLLTLAPGGNTGQDAMTHPGHELVFGLAGRRVYEVAGRESFAGEGVAQGDRVHVRTQPYPGWDEARGPLGDHRPQPKVGR